MSTDIEQGGSVSVQRSSFVMAEFVFLPQVGHISANTDAVARLQRSSKICAHPFASQPQPAPLSQAQGIQVKSPSQVAPRARSRSPRRRNGVGSAAVSSIAIMGRAKGEVVPAKSECEVEISKPSPHDKLKVTVNGGNSQRTQVSGIRASMFRSF